MKSSQPLVENGESSQEAWPLQLHVFGSAINMSVPFAASPPSTSGLRKLLIIDGHAYAYRAFYAIRQLSSPDGRPTNAIYGFIKMLTKLRSWLNPSHLVVVWDGGLSKERTVELPAYKAQRPEMPIELEQQLVEIEAYLTAANIVSLSADGVEADDWIAALAKQSAKDGANVVIASSDKDFMQLVSAQIGLVNANDKAEVVWTNEQVLAKTGVEPRQIVDWLSLLGDSVDNIPGVPGVGPKTAAQLLRQFGSIEGLYQNIAEVKSEKQRAALEEHETNVRRNQRLVRLKEDSFPEMSLDHFVCQTGDARRLRERYAAWGFRSMLRELEETQSGQELLL